VNQYLQQSEAQPKRRYTWPWFVLAAVLLGILLTILWLSREIARTRRIKELNEPVAETNKTARPVP
jgi:hypothetical protein